ncbi:MAG: HyaD/HybD family hydrogenase maturation endopeptidase [Anaerolineae bacterium]
MDRKIVLGLGNTLNRDEGVGVQALKAVEAALGDRAGVEFIDGGTLGLDLLPLVEDSSHLLLLDAVNAGQPPATLVELPGEDIPLYSGIKMSQHQVTFQEVLGLASLRGKLPPHLHLLGVQPADLGLGLDLSPQVQALLPELVHRATAVLRSWGLE